MSSTFSPNLAIELIGTGDQAGSWGTTTNTNLGTLIEQAISGYVTQPITDGADTVITIPNGATGVARNMIIECTGALTAARNLIVPTNKKLYFIYNNTTGGYAVTVKVSGQTGVSVPNGKKMVLMNNGTDIVLATNNMVGDVTGVITASAGSTGNTEAKSDADTSLATTAFAKWLFAASSTTGILDWNDATNLIPGVGPTLLLGDATNGPGPHQYYYALNFCYDAIDGTGNITQLAVSYGDSGNDIRMRGRYSGTWTSWTRVLTTGNDIRTNWNTNGMGVAVAGQMGWQRYGNNHTIFDASNSTSPSGTAVSNTDATNAWTAQYPTLMGWNGSTTHGVRVDSARLADTVTNGVYTTNFTGSNQSLAGSGYQKLPGGLIMQWSNDTGSIAAMTSQYTSFPITFPNAVVAIMATRITTTSFAGDKRDSLAVYSWSTSGFYMYNQYETISNNYNWIAIGY